MYVDFTCSFDYVLSLTYPLRELEIQNDHKGKSLFLGNNNAMSFVLKIKLKSTNRSISSCVRNTETDEHIFLSCFNVSQHLENMTLR
jgi:hypothetical protein